MANSRMNHIHKLKRKRYKTTGTAIFFCVSNCSFKTETHLALGRTAICWRCGDSFTMNEYSIRLAKPHCDDCQKKKPKQSISPVVVQAHDVITTIARKEVNDLESQLRELTSDEDI